MIYLHTESLEIEYTKGRFTKSKPAFSIPSPTLSTLKKQFSKKVAGCGLRFLPNKTTNTDINPHSTTKYLQ